MNSFRKITAAAIMVFGLSIAASAQKGEKPPPKNPPPVIHPQPKNPPSDGKKPKKPNAYVEFVKPETEFNS